MILPLIACWEVGCALYEKRERLAMYRKALAASKRSGKPMLVVGEPDGEYPCPPAPGVVVDLRPSSACKRHVRVSVERMPMFHDKQFGAAFVSHVIEHVEHPAIALRELDRVADQVFVSYPRPWRLTTWLIPGHTWLMVPKRGGFTFHRLRAGGNRPGRYGLGGKR